MKKMQKISRRSFLKTAIVGGVEITTLPAFYSISNRQRKEENMPKERVIPDRVIYPEEKWIEISAQQAGLDVEKFNEILASSEIRGGGWGGVNVDVCETRGLSIYVTSG